ncbi:hypothetical protein RUM44_000235 [Polyplax serrata]|uniref:Ninjurin-2 n=1 Tax=Polyplax serrata TaxID=468196 RepID=A0ABR1B4V3_POLSC
MSAAVTSETSPERKALDVNKYATKKTIAQGMLDIALLTANASQLKYILQVGRKHEFYTLMLGLIITSLILQVIVGILFLIIGGLNVRRPKEQKICIILNDVILLLIFLISLDNVIISSFGIEYSNNQLKLLYGDGPLRDEFSAEFGLDR